MNVLVLIIISGVLIAVSFPGYFIPFSSFFGIFLWLKTVYRTSVRDGIIYSFITGFVFSVLTLYWTVYAITYYGDVSIFLSIPLFLLLASVFSIYQFVLPYIFFYIFKKRYKQYSLFIFPFLWVFIEILREHFPFGGFPWNLLGYSVSYINSLAQIVSVSSIYSLSFLVVFISSITLFSLLKGKEWFLTTVIFSFLFILLLHFWGLKRIENFELKGKEKRVAVIQGNISEDIKLQNQHPEEVIDKYAYLINRAFEKKPDLIVLPESAMPFFYINGDKELKSYFLDKVKNVKVPILLGSDIATVENGDIHIYNSIILLDENKKIVSIYKKIKLVPFGEYVPFPFKIFQSIFPYLAGYDFSRGREKNVLIYKDWKIIPLICFEATFPDFVTSFSKKGNIIVNVSNDGWFGKTVAPFQHFEMARVRAIETGLFFIRATNTGISAVITPTGSIENKLGLFKEGFFVSNIYLEKPETYWIKNHKNILMIFIYLFIVIIIAIEIWWRKKWIQK